MGWTMPTEIKPPFENLPTGFFVANIDEVQEGMVGKQGEEVFGIIAALTMEEPVEVAGLTKEQTFFLGVRAEDKRVTSGKIQADPEAKNDETLKYTLGRFEAFAMAAGVDIKGKDSDVVFSELKNRKVMIKVSHKAGKPRPGESEAPIFSQIDRWLPIGSGIDPHVTEEMAAASKPTASAGPQPARAAAPAPGKPAAAPAPGRPTPQRLGGRTATA